MIPVFLRIILFSCIHLLISNFSKAQLAIPPIREGVLDLRDWDFEENGAVDLDGDWEFYYGEFLNQQELESIQEKNHLYVPSSSWDVVPYKGRAINGYGFATYRLRILLPSDCPRLGIKTIDQSTAYKIFVNEELIAEKGVLGKTAEEHIPSAGLGIFTFDAKKNEISVLIQVSNFSHRKGGLWHSLQLGSEKKLYSIREESLISVIFLCGSLIMMGAYHFLLFSIRFKDKTLLYFALLCLMVVCRALSTNEVFMLNLIPNLSFEWKSKFEYLSFFLSTFFLALYLKSLFPNEFSKKVSWFMQTFLLVFSLLTLLFETSVFSYFTLPYYIFLGFLIIYIIYVMIRATGKMRKGSTLFLAGALFLFGTAVNDSLHSAVIINSYYLATLGFLIFLFSQAALLAIRYADAFKEVESLTLELRTMNTELEQRVGNRTAELAEVNKDLNNKNDKLAETNTIKDKLFSIIAHDFRTPLYTLKGILELLDYDLLTPEEIKSTLSGINKSVSFTTNLLDNLLLWANSQLKGMDLQTSVFLLEPLVIENFELMQEIAKQKNIIFQSEIEDDIQLMADINMTRLILRNLIANAIKFSNNGTIELKAENHGGFCQISVRDEGIGISPSIKGKIFQLSDSKIREGTSKEKGTGLGLLLCKEFIEKNGGEIWVESESGKGATFIFTLPIG